MKPLQKSDFGPGFVWGVATASYQIEGAVGADGRGTSIWDTFSHTPGKIRGGDTGDVACDFYHRYPSDLAYIREMGMTIHRFSLAWSRILPKGTGEVNQKGLDFYQRVIDRTLELGLEPWLTLYHWDLPQALQDQGGWVNRQIVDWFAHYTEICAKAFGDRVKHWMVLNEPFVFTTFGYMTGEHAPGLKGMSNYLPAIHHTALAQAEGGRILRALLPDAQIGTTFSMSHIESDGPTILSQGAADRMDALVNRMFIEPALGLGYPWQTAWFLQGLRRYMQPGDLQKLAFDFDFIGLQTYFRTKVRFSLGDTGVWGKQVKPSGEGLTAMGWEVYPPNIYLLLKKLAAYKPIKRIIITENGAAFPDSVQDGRVHDPQRLAYYQSHLEQVRQARLEGVPVEGYLAWSLLDNFEWAEGYHPRFGLVHVDFETQARTLKDSGRWFGEFLGS